MEAAATGKKKEKAFANISLRSFLVVVILLGVVLAVSGAVSYFIPQGEFLRDADGAIIADSYIEGEVEGISIWRVVTAPVRVFAAEGNLTIIMISAFLLIMSGVFNLLEKTGGIKVFIGRMMNRFRDRIMPVICLTVLVFMAFGSFFGMFEELVTLLPLVVVFMLSLNMDTMMGLGACMMAACFGFAAAITNPFSVGLIPNQAAQQNISFDVADGMWLRIVFFVLVYLAICGFLLWHMRKIKRNPEKSLTYEQDKEKREGLAFTLENTPKERRVFRVFAAFFGVQLAVLVAVACIRALSDLAIPILAVTFLFGGIISGLLVCDRKRDVGRFMLQGVTAMLPAILMLALASAVRLVMEESGIMDTVVHWFVQLFQGQNPFVCVILLYFLILFLQLFIGSASAKIFLIMPIVLPVSSALGISPTLVALTYCMADGFTDVIIPTNPILLVGLSIANVSYGKWVKWTWKVQLGIFLLTLLVLLFAVLIGY